MSPQRLAGLACVLVSAAGLVARSQPPADPALNDRGRAVLAYFQELRASPDFKLLSGQFCGWSGEARLEELGQIHQAAGRWPAVIGLDYCRWNHQEADIGVEAPNELARAYWNAGGLVTISWHAFDPANPAGGGLRDKGVALSDLLARDTPTHQRWMAGLDRIADGLAALQRDGVVVLWRPFHEMNGGWFWWGEKKPADFVAVWRQMFDYFTKERGLHNLVWVYGPNHGSNAADYYPGDAYVDIVGLDAYTDFVDPEHIKGFPALAAIDKPVGLTEFGPHGADHPPGDFDYRRLVDGLARNFPAARFFMSWNDNWNPAGNKFAREFYQDPRVITRESLPAGLAGAAPVADAAYVKSIEDWRAARVARLTKPDGWLSLIGLHQLAPGVNSVGAADDNTIRLAAGPPYLCTLLVRDGRVLLDPAAAALFEIDGAPPAKTELVYQGDRPTLVSFETASFFVIPRGDRLYLRVRDRASARRAHFAGIDYFPIDPSWRIAARWVPFDPPHQVNITNVLGQTEPATVPGKAVFTRAGQTFALLPIDEGAGEPLFFVITDLTAGAETYEASRFVYADRPKDGRIILDFNQAYNPPCAFTPFATCPLPPKENRMNLRVTAGEKKYRGEAR